MKRKRYIVEQIVTVLKETEMAGPFADLIRHFGIAAQTFYRRKQRYADLESERDRKFKRLEEESAKLTRVVADLSRDKFMLHDVLRKEW